ncbi:MAG: hypothetical protein RBS39_07695 [Phycisphaerales bacterium]|jgi:hypothetical protein|nr:hypothetical protein [Phycisphaerales bacterium]
MSIRTASNTPIPSALPAIAILVAIVLAAVASRPRVPATADTPSPASFAQTARDFEHTLDFLHARVAPSPTTRVASVAARAVTQAIHLPRACFTRAECHADRAAHLLALNLRLTHATLTYAAHNLIAAVRFPIEPEPRDAEPAIALLQLRDCILGDPAGDALPDGVLDAGDLCAILARLEAEPPASRALAMR